MPCTNKLRIVIAVKCNKYFHDEANCAHQTVYSYTHTKGLATPRVLTNSKKKMLIATYVVTSTKDPCPPCIICTIKYSLNPDSPNSGINGAFFMRYPPRIDRLIHAVLNVSHFSST